MSQVKGQVIRQRQDRKCPWAAILITKISVADNRLGISSQWKYDSYRVDFSASILDTMCFSNIFLYLASHNLISWTLHRKLCIDMK